MFKRNLFLVIIMFLNTSIIFSKSRVIITGESSIIIESTNNTNLIANKIETISGGKFIKTNGQHVVSENSTDANTAVNDGLPTEFVIEKAYPNPFNPTTKIRYGVSTSSSVNVAIYDMKGRQVYDYKIGEKAPGWHEFTWGGMDSQEQQVSTGMYLVTMIAGEHFQKQKVTFLK
jgi:hypothetical protein